MNQTKDSSDNSPVQRLSSSKNTNIHPSEIARDCGQLYDQSSGLSHGTMYLQDGSPYGGMSCIGNDR